MKENKTSMVSYICLIFVFFKIWLTLTGLSLWLCLHKGVSTGSQTSALLHNVQIITTCMGEKAFVSVAYEYKRIQTKIG